MNFLKIALAALLMNSSTANQIEVENQSEIENQAHVHLKAHISLVS